MFNEENIRKVEMSHLREFTVLFKNADTLVSKSADMSVHTFVCAAVDESDAIRQLRMSRSYSVELLDKRFKTAHMRKSFQVRRFKVVKVSSGETQNVKVIPPLRRLWMERSYFGKGK